MPSIAIGAGGQVGPYEIEHIDFDVLIERFFFDNDFPAGGGVIVRRGSGTRPAPRDAAGLEDRCRSPAGGEGSAIDTTRNTMSGGLLALQRHPDQWRKVRENRALLPGLVQETIRWQTPVIHMRRTAREDAELGGHRIRAGDKVVMWYVCHHCAMTGRSLTMSRHPIPARSSFTSAA